MPTFISKLGVFIELSPCTCMMKYFSVKCSLQKSEQAFPFFLTILQTIPGSFPLVTLKHILMVLWDSWIFRV